LQWTFRDKPLYSHAPDPGTHSVEGADVPGWSNVYTQRAPEFPASFTVQDGLIGQVLADSKGRTLYTYSCTEDTMDQLPCDHPGDTQVYRKAICGAGDQDQCLQDWPYVEALPGETSSSRSWRAITIDPRTGHHADAEQENALRVWSYLGKPVYTYAADQQPGDTFGSSIGETRGLKNGLHAFIIRNDFHQ
jgi:predicted lipoprotein with Yx(FWY)xxD motif